MGNIPANITRQDILEVIDQLNRGVINVPPKQRSTKYCLVYGDRHYPPKYLIRRANLKRNGEELWDFHGGRLEANAFLERHPRSFEVVDHGGAPH